MGSLEELLFSSLQAATPDLPRVNEAIHRLWEDVSRFGPQSLPPLPDLHIPGLGAFEVPPPPPPPPPPPAQSFLRHTANWVADHPWTTAGITVGAVGTSLLVGYAYYQAGSTTVRLRASASPDRRQVVGEYHLNPDAHHCPDLPSQWSSVVTRRLDCLSSSSSSRRALWSSLASRLRRQSQRLSATLMAMCAHWCSIPQR